MKKINSVLALFLLLPFAALGQERPETWTLQTCIDYALEHNITVRSSRIAVGQAQIDVETAKAAYWPSLSLSNSYNYSNRPFATSSINAFSGTLGLNASWTVWDGTRQKNIELQRLTAQQAGLDAVTTENSIVEAIMNVYVQILYAAESVKLSESTLALTEAQRNRGRELLRVGSLSQADMAQLESECSNATYTLVSNRATLQNQQLQLKQLLELSAADSMALELPDYSDEQLLALLPSSSDVYNQALGLRPEVESSRLSRESADISLDIAKAGYQPTVSLSAGTGTGFSAPSDFTFSEQIKSGFNNTAGITIGWNILNGRRTKSAVEKAKLQQTTSELNYLNEQKILQKTIEALWLDASSAQQQFVAASTNLTAMQKSYDLLSAQFNIGMKNTTELLAAQNNLLSAQQSLLQSKYMALYNRNMLDFYRGAFN